MYKYILISLDKGRQYHNIFDATGSYFVKNTESIESFSISSYNKQRTEGYSVYWTCQILWNMSYTLVKQHQAKSMEVEKGEGHRVFILSAFPEFLIDYFGVKLWKTCVKYKMQCE